MAEAHRHGKVYLIPVPWYMVPGIGTGTIPVQLYWYQVPVLFKDTVLDKLYHI